MPICKLDYFSFLYFFESQEFFVYSDYLLFIKYVDFFILFFIRAGYLLLCEPFFSFGEQGLLFIMVHGLLIVLASPVAEHTL